MISELCTKNKISPSQANTLLKIVKEDINRPVLTKVIMDSMEKGFTSLQEAIKNEEAFDRVFDQDILNEFRKLKEEKDKSLTLNKTAKDVLDMMTDKIDREAFLREEQLIQLNALTIEDIVKYYQLIDIIDKPHRNLLHKCLGSHYANQKDKALHRQVGKKFSQVLVSLAENDDWGKKKIGWLGFEYDGLVSNTKDES